MKKNDKSSWTSPRGRLLLKFDIGFVICKRSFFKKRFFEFFRDLRRLTSSRPRGDIQLDLSNFSIYKLLETMRPIFPDLRLNYYFSCFQNPNFIRKKIFSKFSTILGTKGQLYDCRLLLQQSYYAAASIPYCCLGCLTHLSAGSGISNNIPSLGIPVVYFFCTRGITKNR